MYKKSLSELITRYEFEPTLRDIYVEGDRDNGLFETFINSQNFDHVSVYPIQSIDVPQKLLDDNKLSGNKGRVIALGMVMDQNLEKDMHSPRGIADTDFDHLENCKIVCRYLLYTDFSCLESYALSEEHISKFFKIYFNDSLSKDMLNNIYSVLKIIFAIRYTKSKIIPRSSWINDFTKDLKYKNNEITFNKESFCKKILDKSCESSNSEIFKNNLDLNIALMRNDPKNYINGHDAVRLLMWLGRKRKKEVDLCKEAPLHRALISSMEANLLLEHDLFKSIASWATSENT